jgi:hypothetical protein
MRRCIIAGSRSFDDYDYMLETLEGWREGFMGEIISGGAKGADRLGERFAKEFNIPLKIMPADWDKYGKRAGYIRNEQMADYAEVLFAFWDGKSPGTKHMIDIAYREGLIVFIVELAAPATVK